MATTTALTIEQRITALGRPASGFDYLRLVLSVSVMLWHSVAVCYGIDVQGILWDGPARCLAGLILPMFFSLSGFLVCGSLVRVQALSSFLSLRILRIVPALAVEITISALLIGTIFSTVPLGKYFADVEFRQYFLNMVGWIHYLLPGVFADNPLPRIVNGSLWTIPYELECYLVLAVLAAIGAVKHRRWILPIAVLAHIVVIAYDLHKASAAAPVHNLPGRILVLSFITGIVLYLYRDKVRWSRWLFVGALAATMLLLLNRYTSYFVSIPASYVTVYLGLLNPPRNKLLLGGDYSYGIYLYAFPIQQALVLLFHGRMDWWLNMLLGVPCAALFAFASWHGLEKHVMKLKRFVPNGENSFENALIRRFSRSRAAPAAPD